MKFNNTFYIVAILSSISFVGCNKYEDGGSALNEGVQQNGDTITTNTHTNTQQGQNGGNTVSNNSDSTSNSTSGTGGSSSSSSGSSSSYASVAARFPTTMFFNQSVANATLDSQSSTLITSLANRGGWGNGNTFQIDFSIDTYTVDSQTQNLPFVDGGIYLPDSDLLATIPTPPAGSSEGFESSDGRSCDGGDCHFLAIDDAHHRLVEVYEAEATNSEFTSFGGVMEWDTQKTYPVNLRGDVCSSADASGMPIAPLLFTSDEVASGEINHAIRFILPNARIQCRQYVRPATHGTGPSSCSGWATSNGIPYGARLRLRADYPVDSLPSTGAKVVARALQKYGMILADGGQIALTAKSDTYSTHKWSGLLGARDLSALKVTDFQMISAGSRINFTSFDCVRNP